MGKTYASLTGNYTAMGYYSREDKEVDNSFGTSLNFLRPAEVSMPRERNPGCPFPKLQWSGTGG